MAGIVFFATGNLPKIKEFYMSQLGMTVWLEQAACLILHHGNLLLGFCERAETETSGIITLFYETQAEVDAMYQRLQSHAHGKPVVNETYHIYQFFASDPEERTLEVQAFLHPVAPSLTGDDLLLARRSIRSFADTPVPDAVLGQLFELCRFAPSARNSQPCYFLVIRNRETQVLLAGLRGNSSAPIGRAPLAVAICADPEISKRSVQDGCIAAYHFVLAAKLLGLGTCWIADMDRKAAKEALGIPQRHYIATITPLGYPAETPQLPARKAVENIVKYHI